jgi:hypothetical protein
MRKVAGTVANIGGLFLGVAAIVYVAIERPDAFEYTALITLTALGLLSVAGVDLAEKWTTWRPRRHHLLGTASLFGGIGGLALTKLIRADDVAEAIFHGLGVLILLPFALLAFFAWLRPEKHS